MKANARPNGGFLAEDMRIQIEIVETRYACHASSICRLFGRRRMLALGLMRRGEQ
jgi:hypothetical protein